jgi:CRISPR/Cas system-associated endonuclease/helicase Cas3
MQREIEGLIEHQAWLGAPVIILSATLPRVRGQLSDIAI